MKVTTFEGTAEEYKAFLEAQRSMLAPAEQPKAAIDLSSFARAVVRRHILSKGHTDLLRALAETQADLLPDELARRVGVTSKQLLGLLGALGRRINQTPGSREVAESMGLKADAGIGLFVEFPQREGRWHYRLRPEVKQTLQEERII